MKATYEQKFDDIMQYVEIRLDGQGKSTTVNSEEELRTLIMELDEKRQDQAGDKRLTRSFVQQLLQTSGARSLIGSRVGRFKTTKINDTSRTVYYYEQGARTATSTTRTSKKGTVYKVFRDTKTGRFVNKNNDFEEA